MHLGHLPPLLRALAPSRVALLYGAATEDLAGGREAGVSHGGGAAADDDPHGLLWPEQQRQPPPLLAGELQHAAASAHPHPSLEHLWLNEAVCWPAALVGPTAGGAPLASSSGSDAAAAGPPSSPPAPHRLLLSTCKQLTVDLPGLAAAFPRLATLVLLPCSEAHGTYVGDARAYTAAAAAVAQQAGAATAAAAAAAEDAGAAPVAQEAQPPAAEPQPGPSSASPPHSVRLDYSSLGRLRRLRMLGDRKSVV